MMNGKEEKITIVMEPVNIYMPKTFHQVKIFHAFHNWLHCLLYL